MKLHGFHERTAISTTLFVITHGLVFKKTTTRRFRREKKLLWKKSFESLETKRERERGDMSGTKERELFFPRKSNFVLYILSTVVVAPVVCLYVLVVAVR